jgi:flagellar M-ring protein FliF
LWNSAESFVQFLDAWRSLPTRSKAIAASALCVIVLMLALLGRAASTPSMALLYSGLDPSASGEILEALEAMDVPSDVRGDAIYVPETKRDATRMALARDGLPRQSQAGFEILDELSGFSTSTDMFDAAYWRAKEGELARTILAERGVKSARVHIAVPKRSAFARERIAPSAVVTAEMNRGRLDVERAEAMRLLVALATPGLAPEQVAVLDAAGGVVLAPGGEEKAMRSGAGLQDRERALEQDLVNLLEARVGAGNARVKVALAISDEQTVRHERSVDPERRALTTSETAEVSEQGTDGSGVVTVASNLPEGDAAPAATAAAQSRRSENQATSRYEISEVKTETVTMPGALRQVHVAVLINQPATTGEDAAAAPAERSAEEIESLKKLVAAAVGFNEARGDVVTIESMAFDQPAPAGETATEAGIVEIARDNLVPILQLAIPAIVSLILALFVLRPLLATTKPAADAAPAVQSGAPQLAAAPTVAPLAPATPIDELQRIASEQRPAASAVLKTWLEHPEPAR